MSDEMTDAEAEATAANVDWDKLATGARAEAERQAAAAGGEDDEPSTNAELAEPVEQVEDADAEEETPTLDAAVAPDDGEDGKGEQPPSTSQGETEAEEDAAELSVDPVLSQVMQRAGLDDESLDKLVGALGQDGAIGVLDRFKKGFDEISVRLSTLGQQEQKAPVTEPTPPPLTAPEAAAQPTGQPRRPSRRTADQAEQVEFTADDLAQPLNLDALDPDVVGEEVVGFLKGVADRHNFMAAGYAEYMRSQQAQEQRQEAEKQRELVQTADKFFEGIRGTFGDTYGRESINTLDANSPQGQNVRRFLETANTLAAGAAKAGMGLNGPKEVLSMALHLLHPDHYERVARDQLLAKVKKRQGQIIERPSSLRGRGRPTTGDEDALEGAKKGFEIAGVAIEAD